MSATPAMLPPAPTAVPPPLRTEKCSLLEGTARLCLHGRHRQARAADPNRSASAHTVLLTALLVIRHGATATAHVGHSGHLPVPAACTGRCSAPHSRVGSRCSHGGRPPSADPQHGSAQRGVRRIPTMTPRTTPTTRPTCAPVTIYARYPNSYPACGTTMMASTNPHRADHHPATAQYHGAQPSEQQCAAPVAFIAHRTSSCRGRHAARCLGIRAAAPASAMPVGRHAAPAQPPVVC